MARLERDKGVAAQYDKDGAPIRPVKVVYSGYDLQVAIDQAILQERKRILQIIDDYYDLFADEFCEKYQIKEQHPDMWNAKHIIRKALKHGELPEGA